MILVIIINNIIISIDNDNEIEMKINDINNNIIN